jgi:hypothetical protein
MVDDRTRLNQSMGATKSVLFVALLASIVGCQRSWEETPHEARSVGSRRPAAGETLSVLISWTASLSSPPGQATVGTQ